MKAVTLWQPWRRFLLVALRSMKPGAGGLITGGPIAIHAAAGRVTMKGVPASHVYRMVAVLEPMTRDLAAATMYAPLELLPRGVVITTAELVGCHEVFADEFEVNYNYTRYILRSSCDREYIQGEELLFGDWTAGRCAWEFENMKMLPEPIPAKGAQRIWEWCPAVGADD